jgi:MoaA/NifB/PqqE/SkfB family radical SAM enzyme
VKKSEIKHAEVYVTWSCNLNCPTCVQKGIPDRHKGMLSLNVFATFLDRLRKEGVVLDSLEFNGGEPTLWLDMPKAVAMVKTMQPKARICMITNGVRRTAADYDGIDLVRCTDYGAINRQDILRLRSGLGRKRLIVSWVVHRNVVLYGEKRSEKDALPAICASPAINVGPDGMVYACGSNAIEQINGVPVDLPFIDRLLKFDPRMQTRCLNCPSNQRIMHGQYGDSEDLGFVCEFGIWGTPFGFRLHIPWLKWWRWRYLFSRYYRKGKS